MTRCWVGTLVCGSALLLAVACGGGDKFEFEGGEAGAAGQGGAGGGSGTGGSGVSGSATTGGSTSSGGSSGVAGSSGASSTGGTGSPGGTGGTGGSGGGAAGSGGAPVFNCGDGNFEPPGEECDLGASNDDQASGSCPNVCRSSCKCPYCGDGVTDFARGEECDDGASQGGDGCDANCKIEPIGSCGDGNLDIDQGEECDDGGTAANDGCSPNCQLEAVGQACGDNTVDPGEKCDDNNTVNGDGCNPTCNLRGEVTTLQTGVQAGTMAADDRYLWLGDCGGCAIRRIDIDDCLNNGNCAPTTIVGGSCGNPQDGTGNSAVLSCVESIATDGNTVWFGNTHTVRALNPATRSVTTIAGDTGKCAAVDGTGANGLFHDIRGLTYQGGQLYLLDGCENTLRQLDPTTGKVTTIAGTRAPDPAVPQMGPNQYSCTAGFNCVSPAPADDFGTAAVFGSPRYMAADNSGNLFISDTNGQSLRRYNMVTTYVTTLVGGSGYQDGPAASVLIGRPRGMISDGTSLYFGEQNAHTLRQVLVNPVDQTRFGETSTFVGTRGCSGNRDGLGGDGTKDWSNPNCNTAPNGLPRIDTPFGAIAYHFPSRSIYLVASGRLMRIE